MPKPPLRSGFATHAGGVITQMYKSPCCDIEIPWRKARGSLPLWPVTCPRCGKKYHDSAPRKSIWVILFVTTVVVVSVIFVDLYLQTKSFIYVLPITFFLLSIFSVYEEIQVVKNGILSETTKVHKVKFKKQLYLCGLILALIIGYEISKAL